jgi:hypothetical protein
MLGGFRSRDGRMREWLVADCNLFGLVGQNWMWLVVLVVVAYGTALALVRRRTG